MPANKKYLTRSPWLRLSKILAGTLGGYVVMLSFHLVLTLFLPTEVVVITGFITGYLLWALLLLWAFVAQNVWRVWLMYLLLATAFSLLYGQASTL
jgi:hypothetical protein